MLPEGIDGLEHGGAIRRHGRASHAPHRRPRPAAAHLLAFAPPPTAPSSRRWAWADPSNPTTIKSAAIGTIRRDSTWVSSLGWHHLGVAAAVPGLDVAAPG